MLCESIRNGGRLKCLSSLLVCWIAVGVCSDLCSAQADDQPEKKDLVPETFKVKFETTAGDFVVQATRSWSPNGVDRFHKLVTSGFYNDAGFFRVVPGFVVQFGLQADPAEQKKWTEAKIKDDPVVETNRRGTLTFAMAGPNTRTTQLFINYRDNERLDGLGFSPFGVVIEGMDVVDKINSEYRESPNQQSITSRGNQYLKESFPRLDYIRRATLVP